MPMTWPFVGRDRELDLLVRLLRDPSGRGVVVAGAAGVGKSRLVAEAVARLSGRRFAVAHTAGSVGYGVVPFGAFANLLPIGSPAGSDRVNLVRWAGEALVAATAGRRLVVVVDDAQHLDLASAALVDYVVRRNVASVVLVVRSGEPVPDGLAELWRADLLARIDIDPLDAVRVAEVLRGALSGDADPFLALRLHALTLGNLLFLRELVTAAVDEGRLAQQRGLWRWTGDLPRAPRLRELIRARLSHLPAVERAAMELVALGDAVPVEALVRLVPASAVEALESAGLVGLVGDAANPDVRPAHPLFGEVVRGGIPRLRARRQLRERLTVSIRTVGNHVQAIYHKLGVRTRHDLAAIFTPHPVDGVGSHVETE